jgi:cytochrome P450
MRPVRGPRAAYWHASFLRDPVATLIAAYRRHGPLCVLGDMMPLPWRRERLHLLAFGPEFNRQVLGNPAVFHNSTPNPAGSALGRIRSGLTAMNGPKHRQQRRLIQPPFTKKAVDAHGEGMSAIIAPLIARWPAGEVVEVESLMRRLALRLSAGLLFGRENPERVDALGDLIQEYLRRSDSAGVHAFPYHWPGTPYRGLRRHRPRSPARPGTQAAGRARPTAACVVMPTGSSASCWRSSRIAESAPGANRTCSISSSGPVTRGTSR